jgi:hypothetical protein
MNWRVRLYDAKGNVLVSFTIENRTELEAEREAMSELKIFGALVDDWTMEAV